MRSAELRVRRSFRDPVTGAVGGIEPGEES